MGDMNTYKVYVNLKSDDSIIRLIGYIKGRKRSEFFERALIYFLENANEDEILDFIMPVYEKDTLKIIKKVKSNNNKANDKQNSNQNNVKKSNVKQKVEETNNNTDDFESDEF